MNTIQAFNVKGQQPDGSAHFFLSFPRNLLRSEAIQNKVSDLCLSVERQFFGSPSSRPVLRLQLDEGLPDLHFRPDSALEM